MKRNRRTPFPRGEDSINDGRSVRVPGDYQLLSGYGGLLIGEYIRSKDGENDKGDETVDTASHGALPEKIADVRLAIGFCPIKLESDKVGIKAGVLARVKSCASAQRHKKEQEDSPGLKQHDSLPDDAACQEGVQRRQIH